MSKYTTGIHHISAIVGDPQETVDFYATVLGLRLVKKTVNFDDPDTYHLYFGDESGTPGTIITFFPWINGSTGRIGDGQVGVTSYVVPEGALPYWKKRLEKHGLIVSLTERFNEKNLAFEDPHGLRLEIVARARGKNSTWTPEELSPETAIKGFGGATLFSRKPKETAHLLEMDMGLTKFGEENDFIRFRASGDMGNVIDLKATATRNGLTGVGTVHHIAWRTENAAEQSEWQDILRNKGYGVTPVKDRNYFTSIYFRERGQILFEIATDGPGFSRDESEDTLGEQLMLPPQHEKHREKLERTLIPINVHY
ncbi:ring-cleaving dioxygenase [Lacticigenium naphthae]|uniref:ring-cleaving dioxygenase n=1 Tax=Lacticigenium naphthae TaxID=515351 RepID=UPI0003F65BC4|nr:ring-cleaving dioxygenase [Lacticigenium naphthae]